MSTDEQHPDLFSLLRGELGNAQVAAAETTSTVVTCAGTSWPSSRSDTPC